MEYGLVLSGGGSRATFGLGAVKYFEEIGIEFKAYSGASGGAIVASLLACGYSADEAFEILKSIKFKEIIKFNYFRGSLFRFKDQKKFVNAILPFENFEELKKPLFINAVNFNTGETKYFNKGELSSAILASCALFPIFEPQLINEEYYIDGGFTNNLPFEPLKDMVDKTIAIDVNPIRTSKISKLSFIKKIKKTLALMFHANVANKIDKVDLYIAPKEIGKFSFLDDKCLDEAFSMGYEYVKNLNLEQSLVQRK